MKPGSNISNLLWAGFEKVLTVALTLVCTAAIARYFGVELFGAYQYAMSILFVATSLTWLCPAEVLYSKVRSDGTIENNIIVTSIAYRFIISLLVFLGVVIYVLLYVNQTQQLAFILILAITIIYSEPLGVFRFLLECQGYYHVTARIRMLSLFLKVFLTLLLIYFSSNPVLVVIPVIFESSLIALLCFRYIKKLDATLKISLQYFDLGVAKIFFTEGIRLWFGLVCMSFFLKLDRLLLVKNIPVDQFGLYTASFSVLEQLTSMSAMIFAVLGPVLIYRASGAQLQKNTLKLALFMFSLGSVGAFLMYYLSEYFILAVYGEQYAESVLMFKTLVFVVPLVFLDAAINAYIIKMKSSVYFFFKWLLVLLSAFLVFSNEIGDKGWLAGVYAYYTGFLVAVFMSLLYMLLVKFKVLNVHA